MATTQKVINVPWKKHEPVSVNVGSRVRIEQDSYDEPLIVEGTITGVRVQRRQSVDIGQEIFYVIVLIEQRDNGAAREFDLEEIFITYLETTVAAELILDERDVQISATRSLRPFGLVAGLFTVPDDFDTPLPDDLLETFEGRA